MRTMLKGKLHGATVTEANVEYEGSITIDPKLLKAADILPYEQVHVLNLTNGTRIQTYCIEGAPGSGTVCVNGAAAHLMSVNDQVIVISYAQMTDAECKQFRPKIIVLDASNRIQQVLSPPPAVPAEGWLPE